MTNGLKMVTGLAAVEAAEGGAELMVLDQQRGWVPAGPGGLERAKAMAPHGTWIYGVLALSSLGK